LRRALLIGVLSLLAGGLTAESGTHAQTGAEPVPAHRPIFDVEMLHPPEVRDVLRRCPGWWRPGQTGPAARAPYAHGGAGGSYGPQYGQGPDWWHRFRQPPTTRAPAPGKLPSAGTSSVPTSRELSDAPTPEDVHRANAASGVIPPAAVGVPLTFQATWRSEFDRMNPHLPPRGAATGVLSVALRASAEQEDLIVGSVEFRGHPDFQDARTPVFGFAVRGDGKSTMAGTHVGLIGCYPDGTPLYVGWWVEPPSHPEFKRTWGNINGMWHAGFPPGPDDLRYPLRSFDFGSFVIQGVSSSPTAAVKPGAPSPTQAGQPSPMPGASPPARPPGTTLPSPPGTITPPAATPAPAITGLSPDPVPGLDRLQMLTLTGRGFASGARVTLRTGGEVFLIPRERTAVVSQEQIQIRANLTSQPATWTAEVVNPDGRASNRVTFTVRPPSVASSPPPAAGASANRPPSIEGLSQYRADGKTLIPEGGTTSEDTIVFKALAFDPDGDDVRVEVELRQTTEQFIGEPTPETISTFATSGSIVSVTRGGLVSAGYRWRARAVDSRGATGEWSEFGDQGNTDFTVAVQGLLAGESSDRLRAALDGYETAIITKLNWDLETIAQAFADAKTIREARKWADWAKVLLSVIDLAMSNPSLRDAQLLLSHLEKSGHQLELLARLFGFATFAQAVGDLKPPQYTEAVRRMLEEADAVSDPRHYRLEILRQLQGLSGTTSPVPITIETDQGRVVLSGIKEYKARLRALLDDVKRTAALGVTAADAERLINEIKLATATIKASRGGAVELGSGIPLGSIGALERARAEAMTMYDQDMRIESVNTVISAAKSICVLTSYAVPGGMVAPTVKLCVAIGDAGLASKVLTLSYRSGAREQVDQLPFQMLLSLPIETGNLWQFTRALSARLGPPPTVTGGTETPRREAQAGVGADRGDAP
jgi:hypothetical protein